MNSNHNVKIYDKLYSVIGITYAGNHGMEINNSDGSTFTQTMPEDYQQKLDKMLRILNKEANILKISSVLYE